MKNNPTRDAWLTPPEELGLQTDQAHIWRVYLDVPPDSVQPMESTLSADERERAAKFHFEQDRHRFIVAHASLRGILARYLRREPSQLNFSVNEYGKPFLSDHKIEFNLSHSGDFALIAVTRGRVVGIDVEQIHADVEIENLASRNFSPREASELMVLPPGQRTIGFFNCWTRKEAYIKAQGLGLSLPLDRFDVSLQPGESATLRATRPDANETALWTLLSLDVDSGYAGAVAVRGKDMEFRYWDWK
jgi:4'-phosphopantetheinyl transferase